MQWRRGGADGSRHLQPVGECRTRRRKRLRLGPDASNVVRGSMATARVMGHEEKVVQWFNAVDWIQAGSRIAAILVVSFLLIAIARRLISGLEKFTATHAHDPEAKRRAATVSNVLRKLATF